MAARGSWTRVSRPGALAETEKRSIVTACDGFIEAVLKPRFLRTVKPNEWNYVVDIGGAWSAGRYRFFQRYRSGMEHNRGEEFDVPFARIDRMGPDRFDVNWMRHTGKWWPIASGLTFEAALREIETNGVLHPP